MMRKLLIILLVINPSLENGLTLLPRGEVGELCITGPDVVPPVIWEGPT